LSTRNIPLGKSLLEPCYIIFVVILYLTLIVLLSLYFYYIVFDAIGVLDTLKVSRYTIEFYDENPKKTMSYLELYSSVQGVICVIRMFVVKSTIHPYILETKIDLYLSEN